MSLFFQEFVEPLAGSDMRIAPGRAFLQERKDVSATGDGELLSVSEYTGVTRRRDGLEEGEHLSRADSLDGYRVVRPGNLVINYMLAWKGALGVSDLEGITSPAYAVFEIDETKVNRRFAHALFRSNLAKAYFRTESTGIIESRLRLYPESLLSLRMALPPLELQERIARWLDRETARIDALITKKTSFIELLREKRQALITQAVTRGLDPAVPLKESGVPQVGGVPGHWKMERLKYLAESIKAGPFGSALTKDTYSSSGLRVYGQEQVIAGDFSIGDYYVDDAAAGEFSQYRVRTGDVLISCVGTFGKIATVPPDAEPGIINPRLIRLRPSHRVSSEYLETVLRSRVVFEQFEQWSRGGTMEVINVGTLSNVSIPLPPPAEQQELLAHLAGATSRLNALAGATTRSILLLKERRAALITGAVTGQIDVSAEIPEEQPEPA